MSKNDLILIILAGITLLLAIVVFVLLFMIRRQRQMSSRRDEIVRELESDLEDHINYLRRQGIDVNDYTSLIVQQHELSNAKET